MTGYTEVPRHGHPDKLADYVADSIVCTALSFNPHARAAIEVLVTGNLLHVAGEVSEDLSEEIIADVAFQSCKRFTYARGEQYRPSRVLVSVQAQTEDCAKTVLAGRSGDQSIVVGYSSSISASGMPLSHHIARAIQEYLDLPNTCDEFSLLSDGKVLLGATVRGRQTHMDVEINVQHEPGRDPSKEGLEAQVASIIEREFNSVRDTLPPLVLKVMINPGGSFTRGGPNGDTGVTGRKIVADLYGPAVRVGGGALSGKDLTKVDRSGAYAAREWANAIVRSGLSSRCEVTLTYGRNSSGPVNIDIHGVNSSVLYKVERLLREAGPWTLGDLFNRYTSSTLGFSSLALSGHVGSIAAAHQPWENPPDDLISALSAQCS